MINQNVCIILISSMLIFDLTREKRLLYIVINVINLVFLNIYEAFVRNKIVHSFVSLYFYIYRKTIMLF